MNSAHCPHCGSSRMHRSRRRTKVEFMLAILGGRSQRCHECNDRFVNIAGAAIRGVLIERFAKRVGFATLMALTVLIIIGMILWFQRNEPSGSPEHVAAVLRLLIRA